MPVPVAGLLSKAVALAKNPAVQEAAVKAAKKAWDHKGDIKEAAVAATPYVKKAVEKGVAAGSKTADAVSGAASDVVAAVGDTAGSAFSALKASSEKHIQKKELADARQQLLRGATAKMNARDFIVEWEGACQLGSVPPLKSPGYFVIASYEGKPNDAKLHDYADVFVARSENMGESIHRHLRGEGNPDVYADMKYGRQMFVFAFPDFDFEGDNNETLCQFIAALGADRSYNARTACFHEEESVAVEVVGPSVHVGELVDVLELKLGKPVISHQELCGDGLAAHALFFRADS